MKRRKFIKQSAVVIPVGFGLHAIQPHSTLLNFMNSAKDKADPLSLAVSAKAKGNKLEHYWSKCVGAGRANEGLRANWLEQLALAKKECGFQYLRFHGLFHDDMFVYREEDGKPVFNWQYIDELFDRMLDTGIRPFVELGFFPGAISEKPTCFWWGGHGTPPENLDRWKLLVENFVKHCLARYGADEVHQWYFEVWNEPNLGGFWNGTQAQYFDLYKTTAQAIKAIDPALRVGGPATSSYHPEEAVYEQLKSKKEITAEDFIGIECKGPWIEDFLAYCSAEKLPVDFVSSHPYPTSYPIDSAGNGIEISRPVTCTYTDIQWLRKAIAKSTYANSEIHLTEWSSSPSPRDYTHDYLQAATYIVKVNLDCEGLTDSLSYWTFTDIIEEGGAGDSIFHGGFGLINFQGIVKPAFHAYRMLNQLGDEELKKEEGMVVTRDSKTGKISSLLYHYPAEVIAAVPLSKGSRDIAEKTLATGSPKKYALEISDLKPNTEFEIEILDQEHAFALRVWQKMGSPEPPTREQTQLLKKLALNTKKEHIQSDDRGKLHWELTLSPWEVVLLNEV
jgi:xylan 1,4-beta-xylosidase